MSEYLRKKSKLRKSQIFLLTRRKNVGIRKIPKIKNYFKVIDTYPDDVFRRHFMMERTTFFDLESELKPQWKICRFGRTSYSLRQCLYVTIWRLVNKTKFRILSDRFGIAKGSAWNIFMKTIKAICVAMKNQVKWPRSTAEQIKIMEDFHNLRSRQFPFVIGCVDGTHIKIPAPKNDPSSYYNRKGFHSIILQAVCDSKFRFLDIFFGYPGSCHDANVWRNSPLGKALESKSMRLTEGSHLLGDSAYPLASYLIVPFRDNGTLTREHHNFNTIHSSTRVCIEQTFGIFKKKFQILEYLNLKSVNVMKQVVFACTVLHNFIINKEQLANIEGEIFQNVVDTNDEIISDSDRQYSIEGVQKRDYLKNLFIS